MCGLTGFFRPSDSAKPSKAEQRALGRMNDAIAHRGPDEDGAWFGPGVGLAARRLSIIDIKGSQQPRTSPSGRSVCVFNGEIYNFRQLRAELEGLGHSFVTDGDTEILPVGYEHWGIEGLLSRLNGMFGFVIYDKERREVLIARDRLGIKPMYVGQFGETWLFGSELKSLLQHPSFQRDVDPDSLAGYLISEYVATPRCIYKNVRKLRAGHYLRITADGSEQDHCWWQLRWGMGREDWAYPEVPLPAPGDDSEAAWIPVLLHTIREAVRARLVSEVPIGALLSGGVDSSAISALMAGLVPDLRTFSIDFEERSFDESHYSQLVANHIGSQHHSRTLTSSRFGPVLEQIRGFLDEPFADASILPTHFLCQSVKDQGVTVVLSGDGADELFAGYPTYLAQVAARGANAMPGSARLLSHLGQLSDLLPSSYDNITADYMARRFVQGAGLPPARRQATWLGAFLEEEMRGVLSDDVLASLSPSTPWEAVDTSYEQATGASSLERLLHLDLKTYLGDDILVKVDRASMACSLEVRTPFLDHRVVEMAARIPPSLKLRGTRGKYLLKKAIAPQLPREITRRGKKGFGLPVAHWLRGPLRELLLDTLGSGGAASTGWFKQDVVDQLIDDHLSGRRDRRKLLWTLLMFRWWEQGAFGPGAAKS
jgi:asparagine synthase (glutamine-hydrolysing)